MNFKNGDIVKIAQHTNAVNSGNSTPSGTKVVIISEYMSVGPSPVQGIRQYIIHLLNGVNAGWIYETEIECDYKTKESLAKDIENFEKQKIELNQKIVETKNVIEILEKYGEKSVTEQEIKIMKLLDIFDVSTSKFEKSKIISEILNER